jgi:hypothetical protein
MMVEAATAGVADAHPGSGLADASEVLTRAGYHQAGARANPGPRTWSEKAAFARFLPYWLDRHASPLLGREEWSMRDIEAALSAWREAIRKRDQASNGDREALDADVERAAAEFQRMSAEHMEKQLDALRDAEDRRREATPSTRPFHEAAREEEQIAAEIFNAARISDEESPRSN